MDPKQSPAQADPRRDGDVVVLAPKDWTDADEALSKLAHLVSDRRPPTARSDFSAGPRVTEPSPDATLRPADLTNVPTDWPSSSRRTWRSLARFLGAACVGVVATLAWQSYGGTAKRMIASSVPQLSWLLSSPPATNPPTGSEIAVEQPSPPAVQASAPQTASVPQAASAPVGPVAPTASETAALPAPTGPSPELQQQLETMAHDLAAVRQSVEQLAAGQEQMARDIAKLQTARPEIRGRISAPPPAAAPTARKPIPPPQPSPRSAEVPLPAAPPEPAPQSLAAPLPPPPPDLPGPPRPPMPVR